MKVSPTLVCTNELLSRSQLINKADYPDHKTTLLLQGTVIQVAGKLKRKKFWRNATEKQMKTKLSSL
jgi:hypothetical protein